MRVTVGKMLFGKIDELGDQWIATKFLVLGVPLFPLESVLFLSPDRGLRIPLLWRSAGLAYLRMVAGFMGFFGAFALGIIAFADGPEVFADAGMAAFSGGVVAMLALWSVATFRWGKLRGKRRTRAARLAAGCGLSVDPALLPSQLREATFTRVVEGLKQQGIATDAPIGSDVSRRRSSFRRSSRWRATASLSAMIARTLPS